MLTEMALTATETPSLYFCPVCAKPFTLETSYTRHVRYCRQRAAINRTARPRACRHCRTTKSKCDSQWPCGRCAGRQTTCVYDKPRMGQGGPGQGGPGSRGSLQSLGSPGTAEAGSAAAAAAAAAPATSFDPSLLAVTSTVPTSIPGATTTLAGDGFGSSASSGASGSASSFFFLPALYGFGGPDFGHTSPAASTAAPASVPSPIVMHLPYAPPPGPVLEATDSQQRLAVPQQLRRLITSMLRAFPRMMTRPDSLPPFVHRVGCGLHYEGRDGLALMSVSLLPDPFTSFAPLPSMAACVGISHAFVARSPHSDEFLWRTIETEHLAIKQRLPDLSLGETLASIQAVAIYTTMRLIVYGREYFIADMSLLDTLNTLSGRFDDLWRGTFPPTHDYGYDDDDDDDDDDRPHSARPAWEDWILEETRRRITMTCWLMSLAVSLRAPLFQPRQFPLPSSRRLWEATTRAAWERAYDDDRLERRLLARGSSGVSGISSTSSSSSISSSISTTGSSRRAHTLGTVGDLANAIDRAATAVGQLSRPSNDALHEDDLLARWHGGVDSLGMVLTAAAAQYAF